MNWKPISEAPKDGTKIWGWLNDSGIHLVQWMSAEQNAIEAEGHAANADEYIACWVKSGEPSDGDWSPPFWLPFEAIAVPPGIVWVNNGHNGRWRTDPRFAKRA